MSTDDLPLEDVRVPSDNEMKSIVALAREQWHLERLIENLKQQLKEAEEKLANVAERELPNLMVETGTRGFTLANGAELVLKEDVFASITIERQNAAHDWLEKNGHSDLIKREFNIRFNREDEGWAKKFERDVKRRKRPLNYKVKRAVHPQTLNKWVREMVLAGAVIPEDLFGVFRKKVAKIIPPKKELLP